MIKYSIIVPVYGVEKYIERCVRSLFQARRDDIEYIFVNDCTKDNSVEIVRRVAREHLLTSEQMIIINHDKNLGLGASRLTGLMNASGEYVWFVDSDDFIEATAFSVIDSYVDKGYDYILFNYFLEKANGSFRFRNDKLTVCNVLYTSVTPSIWKCIIKRALLIDNKIFPVQGINQSEDYLLTARLILVSKKPKLIDDHFLYHYNLTNVNSYVNNVTEKSLENCVDTCFIVRDFYSEHTFTRAYKICLSAKMAFWYMDFEHINPNNPKCRQLYDLISKTDYVIALILKMRFLNREKLIRAYKKICV